MIYGDKTIDFSIDYETVSLDEQIQFSKDYIDRVLGG